MRVWDWRPPMKAAKRLWGPGDGDEEEDGVGVRLSVERLLPARRLSPAATAERLFRAFLEGLSDLDLVTAISDLRRAPEDARHLRWALEELAKRARLATRGRH